jgi:hypothetical protein
VDTSALVAREHLWLRVRLLGWALTALAPLRDILVQLGLVSGGPRLLLNVLTLVGIALVALGFERILETAHRRAGVHG